MFEDGKPITARRVAKWAAGTILAAVLTTVFTGTFAPWLNWFAEKGSHVLDAATCGGRAAEAEGDRLSTQAAADVTRAQELFREANVHYAKAYACPGFPDAGIRLAVAHCMGLGVPKNLQKARQYINEIEGKHEGKRGRAKEARQLCGLPH